MATANLKERIDHFMNYETLRRHAPPPRRVAVIAVAALVLFTVASAMAGRPANSEHQSYTVSIDASQNGDIVIVSGTVREDATGAAVTLPPTKLTRGSRGGVSAVHDGLGATFEIRPDGDDLAVDVTVRRDGALTYTSHVKVLPNDGTAGGKYTGEPISLSLKDADLRDVLQTFGKLTGMEVRLDDAVQGKVTVVWQDIPWDKALDTLLAQNGCSYRIEGHALIITKN